MQTYIALLRGINVGGHHKVPMAALKKELARLGFEKIQTLLNSGNVIFETPATDEKELETKLAQHLEEVFGFPIPTLVRKAEDLQRLIMQDPFAGVELTDSTRLYVTFLREKPAQDLILPWTSEDGAFKILGIENHMISSVVDISIAKTPQAMGALESMFGKDITTRNWNTVNKIVTKATA